MQLLKVTSNNLILSLVDDGDIALAGKSVRAITDAEETTINTLWQTTRYLVDDPSAGIRAEMAAETLARQPIAAQITAQFAALPVAARAALLPTSAGVLAALENKDYPAGRALVSTMVNPGGSGLTSEQFAALQTAILAVLPNS